MSLLSHRLASFALLVLLAISGTAAATAEAGQIGAVKDGWLVMKVHSEMLDEDILSGSDIDVDVKDGVVTLQGTVPSEAARSRALEVARKNDGVKKVVDQLKIAPARGSNHGQGADKTEPPARRRRTRLQTLPRKPAAPLTMAGSSRRSTRSTWPTGTRFSTTATSTSTSRTTS